jgi:hypothetical protein
MKLIKWLVLSFICLFSGLKCHENRPPQIFIWIHGTRLVPDIFSKKYFYRKLGMHRITDYGQHYNCRAVAEALCSAYPNHYSLNHYYYFGWSGKLSFEERKNAAKDLYKELLYLSATYIKTYGQAPVFRIMTHSHGGNVLLNLARIIPENSSIVIEEAILLACPVQDRTKEYTHAPCFKKIYAFYSGKDMFQIIDPQGWYKKGKTTKHFSGRTFEPCEKLRQARIMLNGQDLTHMDFFLLKFMKHLPMLCKEIDNWHASLSGSLQTRGLIIDVRDKKSPATFHFAKTSL